MLNVLKKSDKDKERKTETKIQIKKSAGRQRKIVI